MQTMLSLAPLARWRPSGDQARPQTSWVWLVSVPTWWSLTRTSWWWMALLRLPLKGTQYHGPLTRYEKLWVAHALGMLGTFSSPPTSKEIASQRSRHASRYVRDARVVMQVGFANPQWQGKRSRHYRRMHNPEFYASGKRPMAFRNWFSSSGWCRGIRSATCIWGKDSIIPCPSSFNLDQQ